MSDLDNVKEKVLLRGGKAVEWTAKNPLLLFKELGIETDTYGLKLGDGKTKWNQLPYLQYSKITKILIDKWNQTSKDFNNLVLPSETDPIFTSSPAFTITSIDIANWNALIGGSSITEDDVIAYAVAL